MMKIVITELMSVTLAVAPDTIPATGGNITIQPINHATLELTYGGKVIDIDPVAQANFEGLAAPDIILVTDIHQDHLDPSTVAKRKKDTTKIVAPPAAASKLENAIAIKNGETKDVDGIGIEAVPMNLPYTMPPSEAAECVKAFKQKIVYPYHYRGQNLDEFANALKGSGVDVRIRDWYSK